MPRVPFNIPAIAGLQGSDLIDAIGDIAEAAEEIDAAQQPNASPNLQELIERRKNRFQSLINKYRTEEEEDDKPTEEEGNVDSPSSHVSPTLSSQNHCKEAYLNAGNCKIILLAMCVGLAPRKDGRVPGDIESSPYKEIGAKKKPKLADLRTEVKRRADVMKEASTTKMRLPVPNNWNKVQCIKWLSENPVNNATCVAWILESEEQYFNVVKAALASKNAQTNNNDSSGSVSGIWRTNDPWLRR